MIWVAYILMCIAFIIQLYSIVRLEKKHKAVSDYRDRLKKEKVDLQKKLLNSQREQERYMDLSKEHHNAYVKYYSYYINREREKKENSPSLTKVKLSNGSEFSTVGWKESANSKRGASAPDFMFNSVHPNLTHYFDTDVKKSDISNDNDNYKHSSSCDSSSSSSSYSHSCSSSSDSSSYDSSSSDY